MASGDSAHPKTDVARIRLVLMRELETISTYEMLAAEAGDPAVKAFFEHLAHEEKEHVAEATGILRQLDSGQAQFFERTYTLDHFTGAAAPPSPEPTSAGSLEDLRVSTDPRRTAYGLPAPPNIVAGPLTVGPLKRRA